MKIEKYYILILSFNYHGLFLNIGLFYTQPNCYFVITMRYHYFVQEIYMLGAKLMQFLFEKFSEEVYDGVTTAAGGSPLLRLRVGRGIRIPGILSRRRGWIRWVLGILWISRITTVETG